MNKAPPTRSSRPSISDSPETEPLQAVHPYPADRSFVLKLHRSADLAAGELRGRIVHLASDQRADFNDADTLLPMLRALVSGIAAGAASGAASGDCSTHPVVTTTPGDLR